MSTLSLIRWAGGKGKQLNDLLPLIPQSRVYVEPFGGGLSVLLNRRRSSVEVVNDLDSALVNLFQVVRDPVSFVRFQRTLALTPYARTEFESALVTHLETEDPVRRAAAFYTMINQSISGKRLASKGDWARGRVDNLAERWFERQEKLPLIHERLKHVQIECRDALDILREWDGVDTTFYLDPPYILETRTQRKYYAVEPGDEYHKELVDVLVGVQGSVVLSGYDHEIYRVLSDEHNWWTDEYGARASMEVGQQGSSKQKRREIVYRNPRACEAGIQRPLSPSYDRESVLWADEETGVL